MTKPATNFGIFSMDYVLPQFRSLVEQRLLKMHRERLDYIEAWLHVTLHDLGMSEELCAYEGKEVAVQALFRQQPELVFTLREDSGTDFLPVPTIACQLDKHPRPVVKLEQVEEWK